MYPTNPRYLIEPWAAHVVQLWAQCRGEFGMSHLPDTGGINDQALWLMEAFVACNSIDADLRKEERARGEGQR